MKFWSAILTIAFFGLPVTAWCQSCTVAATGLAFGAYQPMARLASNSTATVTVTCNPGLISLLVSYQIQMGAGTGGSFAMRSMGGTSTPLRYQLYTDALDTQIWGNGTAGTVAVSDGYLLGVILPIVRTYPCYGNIPALQTVNIGFYTDMISILISY